MFIWVKQEIGGKDPGSSQGKAQSNCDRAGRDRGSSLEAGSPSPWKGPHEHQRSNLTSVKKHTPGSAPCRRSVTLQGDTAGGYRLRAWLQAGLPRVLCPTGLTKLPSCVGLCSLAAVAKLHERVQGARGHGQVDGVAEGGAVRGRKGKAQKPLGSGSAQSSPRHPISPPTGLRARRSRSQELSRGKGPQEGRNRPAVRAASQSLAQPPRSPPAQAGSRMAPRQSPGSGGKEAPSQAILSIQMSLSLHLPSTQTPPPPKNTHGVTQMNLVFRYGAAPAEERAASSSAAGGGTLLSPPSRAQTCRQHPPRQPLCSPHAPRGPHC